MMRISLQKLLDIVVYAFFSACTGFVVPICSVLLWIGEHSERRKHRGLKPQYCTGHTPLRPGHYWAD
jgi:hypothetical protein